MHCSYAWRHCLFQRRDALRLQNIRTPRRISSHSSPIDGPPRPFHFVYLRTHPPQPRVRLMHPRDISRNFLEGLPQPRVVFAVEPPEEELSGLLHGGVALCFTEVPQLFLVLALEPVPALSRASFQRCSLYRDHANIQNGPSTPHWAHINMLLSACLVIHGSETHTHTHTLARTHARTHARVHVRTQRDNTHTHIKYTVTHARNHAPQPTHTPRRPAAPRPREPYQSLSQVHLLSRRGPPAVASGPPANTTSLSVCLPFSLCLHERDRVCAHPPGAPHISLRVSVHARVSLSLPSLRTLRTACICNYVYTCLPSGRLS